MWYSEAEIILLRNVPQGMKGHHPPPHIPVSLKTPVRPKSSLATGFQAEDNMHSSNYNALLDDNIRQERITSDALYRAILLISHLKFQMVFGDDAEHPSPRSQEPLSGKP
jgi:hypothetical protein